MIYLKTEFLIKLLERKLKKIEENPNLVSNKKRAQLEDLYGSLIKCLGISESGKWCIKWEVEKFKDREAYNAHKPFETCVSTQNVILNDGANNMLKVICGISGAVPYDNANAQIGIGTNTTPESPEQTGLLATGSEVFYKRMETGYPQVSGRVMVFKSVYDTNEANFTWNEFAIVNGTGVGGIAMNRKVQNLGTKTTGIWSLQITVTVTSNT